MTEQEAIKKIGYIRHIGNGEQEYKNCAESIALDIATKALEKQTPKKPVALQHGDYRCPSCNRIIRMFEAVNFCMFCGQAIDWGEEE